MNKLKNYLKLTRVHQPTGIWLLFLPCLFGIFLSLGILKNISPSFGVNSFERFSILAEIVLIFFLGSVLMRSVGCIINDLFDQKIDAQVTRTRNRPLAAGLVSKTGAIILTLALLLPSLYLLLCLKRENVLIGFVALILVIIYPLTKRVSYFPQIFLGIIFNVGVLMGSVEIFGRLTAEAFLLYLATIIWTLIYDTIYAFQDIEDDLKIGVKSSAIFFKENPKKILFWLTAIMLMIFFILGIYSKFSADYFFLTSLAHIFLARKIFKCDFKNPKKCLSTFKSSVLFGLIILVTLALI